MGRKEEEIKIPLSRLLHTRDCREILAGLAERVVRDLTYERPEKWFQYIERRFSLGCPAASQRARLYEMKAARDCLEHNRGVVNRDYLDKAGGVARFGEGDPIQIDEPYLLGCFGLLRAVIVAMADATVRIASSPKPPRRHHRGRDGGKLDVPVTRGPSPRPVHRQRQPCLLDRAVHARADVHRPPPQPDLPRAGPDLHPRTDRRLPPGPAERVSFVSSVDIRARTGVY